MNMSIFRERKNLEELRLIFGNTFMEYKVIVCDNREIVSVLDRLGLIGQFVAHLGYDDPDGLRYGWFQEKTRIEHQDYHIYVILYNGMEIVATRAWSQYITYSPEVYAGLLEKLGCGVDECINGNTLIVNPNYRCRGIAKGLKSIGDEYWLGLGFKYVMGNTDNPDALRLYMLVGAKMYLQETYQNSDGSEDTYWYYATGSLV